MWTERAKAPNVWHTLDSNHTHRHRHTYRVGACGAQLARRCGARSGRQRLRLRSVSIKGKLFLQFRKFNAFSAFLGKATATNECAPRVQWVIQRSEAIAIVIERCCTYTETYESQIQWLQTTVAMAVAVRERARAPFCAFSKWRHRFELRYCNARIEHHNCVMSLFLVSGAVEKRFALRYRYNE